MNLSFDCFAYKKKPSVLSNSGVHSFGNFNDNDEEKMEKSDQKKRKCIIESESDEEEKKQYKRNRVVLSDSDGDKDNPTDLCKVQSPFKHKDDILNYESSHDESDLDCNTNDIIRKQMLFDFITTCTLEDLVLIPGFSLKKAEKVKGLLPFHDYNNMIEKLNELRGFSINTFLSECSNLLDEQKNFQSLIAQCEAMSRQTESEVFLHCNDVTKLPIQKPSLVNEKVSLKSYQLVGLNWLVMLHRNNLNGILADQMGLGKTVQTLAFIGYLLETGHKGTTLIVCPCSTMDNWVREFEKWLPNVSFTQYTGSQSERALIRQHIKNDTQESSVIISTINHVLGTKYDRNFFRSINLQYLILDEAHMIKNVKTERFKHLSKLKAPRKILLTGTPFQNDVIELISLLTFLMPNLFEEFSSSFYKERLKFLFASCYKTGDNIEDDHIGRLKKILKPFVLRRLKQDVLKEMPNKIDSTVICELTASQKQIYLSFAKRFSDNTTDQKMGLSLLMLLRKTTNHPLLVRVKYSDSSILKMAEDYVSSPMNNECDKDLVYEDMSVMSDFELHKLCSTQPILKKYKLCDDDILDSGKIKQLDKLLPELKEKNDRVLLFSQFVIVLDILEEYLKIRKIKYLRLDGSTKGNERQELIDKFNHNEEIFIFLLSTRAGGLGINLTTANTVVLHDIDFNPYNDKQAEDRCHRLGQTRQVTVYKFIGKDTVEENILTCGERKLQLEKELVGNTEIDLERDLSDDAFNILRDNIKKIEALQRNAESKL
ncbi:SWI/SNF-related matrix-associated actin-dependent regulator of chromatin subfamily A containing DEAD/H box 1 isoform X3 [Hydra vulgaris]|uniref:SWI/SNF-related matrix-associated actin-dependent regulator of chromatin subfamily A containing DEAD/H box 1 isoform X3 n=1 Tax=Hydra vulgaris TaxID=6087 RepID=A0ABM4BK12_HYDVU